MSNSDDPSLDGVLSSSSSAAPETLTVYSATVVSTTFIPQATLSPSISSGSDAPQSTSPSNSQLNQSDGGHRTTIIVLATVFSIAGCVLLAGIVWLVIRCRRRRTALFARGITPIGDDEIETWKGRRTEKGPVEMDMECPPRSPTHQDCGPHADSGKRHQKSESTTSIRKPPSVIVYARPSEELSPLSPNWSLGKKTSLEGGRVSGKPSFDKEPPIQARAPNAREGLTDEAIPGDEPFVHGSPKRRGSRLSKQAPPMTTRYGGGGGGGGHTRNKSSRSSSSLYRLGGYGYESSDDYYYQHRPSQDCYQGAGPSRVLSPQDPPRLSLSEEWPSGSGVGSSPRLWLRAEDIGRAIG